MSFGALFDQDSLLWRSLSFAVDVLWLSVLVVVACIPLITVGAALVAGVDMARHLLRGEGHLTGRFVRTFFSQLRQSTISWLILGFSGVLLLASLYVQATPLMVAKIGLGVVWSVLMLWVWPLQAMFSNTILRTWRNALIFGIGKPGVTLIMAATDVAWGALLYISFRYMPQGLPLVMFFGPGLVLVVKVQLLQRALAPYLVH
ncbi:uncharacterized protein DUF624 [Bifidobacterium psychraerophilum DSM 22366]|uniref:Uncharacterized protein n=2 Tax=Bifidobacterium psychraerophilum TaxID=218140 RepID=A0A087CJE0_9BIFI|nr:hypothetical protein BPSY_0484 [Bifidobacterium psychraerophilum]PKA94439.1 uncharacterized protein DUF624 [Bifidobacterium psychraerophilum DSM 22366]